MIVIEFFKKILFDPKLSYYLTLVQIPIVLCLAIQSFQAYKLNFKAFRLICIAWCINAIYLLVNVLMKKNNIDSFISIPVRTFLDLLCMSVFLFAVIDTFENGFLAKLKRIPTSVIISGILIACVAKSIPGSLHLIPLIHLRYLPAAFFDFTALFLLAMYFRDFTRKFHRKKFLVIFTLIYASLQFLWVLQVEQPDPKQILMKIDNIGFAIGLIAKMGILVSLSIALIRATEYTSRKEKERLLRKLSFSSTILNVGNLIKEHNEGQKEEGILEAILKECLSMLELSLGYYAQYDKVKHNLTITYTSKPYQNQKEYTFSCDEGMGGKAVIEKKEQINNKIGERSDYIRFSKLKTKKKPTNVDKYVRSAAVFPVLVDNEPIGVYMFESEEEDFFTKSDISVLSALVSQGATAVKNYQLIEELSLSRTLLQGLMDIDRLMTGKDRDLENILEFILKQALSLAKGQLGNIALIDKSRNDLVIVAEASQGDFKGKHYALDDSISGLAVLNRDTVYIPNLKEDTTGRSSLYKNFTGAEANCDLVIPLIVNDEVIGVFNTESVKANSFSNAEIERVESFARQAAIAIHIFQLFAENKKHRDSLSALAEIDLQILNYGESLSKTLELILKKGLKLVQKKHAGILLLEENKAGEKFLVIQESTLIKEIGLKIPLKSKSICNIASKRNMIVYLPFIDKDEPQPIGFDPDEVYFPNIKERTDYYPPISGKMKSELVLPLIVHTKTIGFLNIESEHYNDFRPEDIALLKNLALTSALAIHNAQQFEEIRRQNKELINSISKEKFQWATSLAKVINHRVGNSGGYIRRILLDQFKTGNYLNDKVKAERYIKDMLEEAQRLIDSREEIAEQMQTLLADDVVQIDFTKTKATIEERERKLKNDKYKVTVLGFDGLSSVAFILPLFYEAVVFELIQNAKKAMPNGGEIVISGKMDENHVILEFTDFGHGIPEDDLERIFSDGFTKWNGGVSGTGHGLFNLSSTLEFFRGKISVKSKVDEGTTFTIHLPISDLNNN